jgi:hypothetical protein
MWWKRRVECEEGWVGDVEDRSMWTGTHIHMVGGGRNVIKGLERQMKGGLGNCERTGDRRLVRKGVSTGEGDS